MANLMRWRYGDTNPRKLAWKATFGISIGDCCWLDSTDTVTPPDQASSVYPVKKASDLTWQTAITDPTTAPNITAVASPYGPGFTVASTGFKVAYTYVTLYGQESTASALSSAMSTNTDGISAALPAGLPASVYKVNWYVTTDGGDATTLKLAGSSIGGYGIVLSGPPSSNAAAPPATSQVTATALTQGLFAQRFAGVSPQYYNGDTITSTTLPYGVKDGYIRIDSDGVFDFACDASSNFNEGDLVGMEKDSSGNFLYNQQVIAVPVQAMAIGRVVAGTTSASVVRVQIFGQKSLISRPTILT